MQLFTKWHFVFIFMGEKAFTYEGYKKKKKCHSPTPRPRCLSCLASSSILLNTVNWVINAAPCQEAWMRWAASGAIDPNGENETISGQCSQGGSNNNCRRWLNWGVLNWTQSLELNGSHPFKNDSFDRIPQSNSSSRCLAHVMVNKFLLPPTFYLCAFVQGNDRRTEQSRKCSNKDLFLLQGEWKSNVDRDFSVSYFIFYLYSLFEKFHVCSPTLKQNDLTV